MSEIQQADNVRDRGRNKQTKTKFKNSVYLNH